MASPTPITAASRHVDHLDWRSEACRKSIPFSYFYNQPKNNAYSAPHIQSKRNTMILELADIRIQPGQQTAFNEAIERGLRTVISGARGFKGFKVNQGIENPERYVLQIFWATLEDHTVGFRESPEFANWRAIVGPFFAAPPVVEHFELLMKSE
jgi:heme-degrading monooxygenase HmoA